MTVATLGLAVDSSQAVGATKALNDLTAAAKPAAASMAELTSASTAYQGPVGAIAAAAKRVGVSFEEMQAKAIPASIALKASAEAAGHAASAHSAMSTQAMAAGHSIRSAAEMFAMGIPPTQILASQMNHLSYAASGPGGITGAFQEAIGVFSRFITPLTVTVGAVAALGTGAIYAASSWNTGEKDITRSLLGIGKASGTTIDDIHHFSAASALATKESFATARSVATELVSSSGVARDHIGKLTTTTLEYAKAMDVGSDEAAKFIATALVDPLKGAETINEKIQFLDNSTRAYIKTLMDSGDVEKARSVVIDKMAPAIDKAGKATEGWAISWKGLKTTISDIGSAFGATVGSSTDREQLTALKARRDTLQAEPGAGFAAERQAIADLTAQIDKIEAKVKQANEERLDLGLNNEAAKADAFVRSLDPSIEKIQALDGAIKKLNEVRDNPATFAKMNLGDSFDGALAAAKVTKQQIEDQAAATDRINAKTLEISGNYKGYSIEVAKTLDAQKGQLVIASAITGQERLAAQEAAHRHALEVDKGYDPNSAALVAAGQRKQAEAQIQAHIEGQLLTMRDQLVVAQAVTGQQQLAAQEVATQNQLIREGVDVSTAQAVASQQREIAEARINSQIENQIVGLDQQRRMINAVANGTEASTAAAIAYENAIRAGASATEAAALKSAVLATNMAKVSAAAYDMSQKMHYASGGSQEFGNQWGNQEVGLPGTSGTDLQQAMWKTTYGAGGYNTFINGGFGINGGRFDVNAMPNDQGLQYMHAQTLKAAAEKNMDSVTRAKFEAGSYKLPQSQAQAIADAFLAQNNNSSNVNAQKAASDFVGSADSSSSTSNSLINPMYTSGSSNVIAFRAASGMDYTVPGTGPVDSVRVSGLVSPGERLIAIPPGGAPPADFMQNIMKGIASKAQARAAINQRIVIQAASMRGASDTMSQLAARAARAAAAAARRR